MELFAASNQWATRPADERFANLRDMYDACKQYADIAKNSTFTLGNSKAVAVSEDVLLEGKTGIQAKLTHHAFGQMATLAGAPANYLRSLPSELAAQNLNHGFGQLIEEKPKRGLFHTNGDLICRCITSTKYERIWNHEIVQRLIPLQDDGWTTPPASRATNFDGGYVGESHGLYASDHDMFAFLIDGKHRIDDGSDGGLGRGFFAINSEVGSSAFKLVTFLYRYICGNHIVWGAENVNTVSIRHIGSNARNWHNTVRVELTKYAESSAKDDEAKITAAKKFEIGATKEEVLDALFSQRTLGITRKDLDASYSLAEVDYELTKGAPPNTVWGMVQGITRHSQSLQYADARTKLDTSAGKVLEMAF